MILYWIRILNQVEVDGELVSTFLALQLPFFIAQATGDFFVRLFWRWKTNDPISVERINSYINIEQELKPTEGGNPPAYWPASGELVVENLTARYSSVSGTVGHRFDCSFSLRMARRSYTTCLSISNQERGSASVRITSPVLHYIPSSVSSRAYGKWEGTTSVASLSFDICLDLFTEFLDSGAPALHHHRRNRLLWWNSHDCRKPRCASF